MRTFSQYIDDRKLPDSLTKTTETKNLLRELLASLRALYWNYQTSHWQTKGENFYGNHLLFQRLYEKLGEEVDDMAEKLVGYFNEESVDSKDSITRTQNWIQKWAKITDPVQRSIEAEKDFQRGLRHIYDTIKANDDMHLGLDDFLMSISSDHDTNLYLLQQIKR